MKTWRLQGFLSFWQVLVRGIVLPWRMSGSRRSLIPVRAVDSGAPASHLGAQAGVSTETLLRDGSASARLRQLVENSGGNPDWIPGRVGHVAIVMADTKPRDADALFTFSKVRLARLADECRILNVELSVQSIVRA
jgi:uncharacterized protein (TIGR04141 family)